MHLAHGIEGAEAELRALDAGADAFLRKDEEGEVILARLAARSARLEARRQDTTACFAPKRVMAVDDSATYLQELATILRGEGYDVVLAHSGEEAVDMLAVQSVDCILIDMMMPGLGGHETCRRIKASPASRHAAHPADGVRGAGGDASRDSAAGGRLHREVDRLRGPERPGARADPAQAIRRRAPADPRGAPAERARGDRGARRHQAPTAAKPKMEAMGKLTGGVAHDFNNLFEVIVANADLLLETVKDSPAQAELVDEILASAAHGAQQTHRLLAFGRQQPCRHRLSI